jgi:hypothetical protein
MPAAALALLALGSLAIYRRFYTTAVALASVAAVLQVAALAGSPLSATAHAYDALVITIWTFVLVHVAIAVLMAVFVKLRTTRSRAVLRHRGEPAVTALFWHYSVAQYAAAYAAIHLVPRMITP